MAQASYQPMANTMASQYKEIEQLKHQIQDLQTHDTIAEQTSWINIIKSTLKKTAPIFL